MSKKYINWETWTYQQLQSGSSNVESTIDGDLNIKRKKEYSDFRNNLNITTFSATPFSSSADQQSRINFPDLGRTDFILDFNSYVKGFNQKSGSQDIVYHGDLFNRKPIISTSEYLANQNINPGNDSQDSYNDFVHFSIESIQDKKIIPFRSFIDDFSDSYTSNWESIKYPGRGDEYKLYQSTNRKTSVSWRVVSFSQIDLFRNYEKLNYLASLMYPKYNKNYMQPNILRLGLGNWFRNTPVIMTSLNYKIDENTPWDIDINQINIGVKNGQELPLYINVSADFDVLHDSLPQSDTKAYFIRVNRTSTSWESQKNQGSDSVELNFNNSQEDFPEILPETGSLPQQSVNVLNIQTDPIQRDTTQTISESDLQPPNSKEVQINN